MARKTKMAFQVTNLQPLHKPLVLVAQPSSSSGWATAGDLLLGNTCPRLVVTPLQFIPVLKQDLSFFFPSCNVWTCSSDVILSSNLNTTRREKKKTQKVFEIYYCGVQCRRVSTRTCKDDVIMMTEVN